MDSIRLKFVFMPTKITIHIASKHKWGYIKKFNKVLKSLA